MGADQLPQDSSSQFVPHNTVSMHNALLFVCYKIVTASNFQISLSNFCCGHSLTLGFNHVLFENALCLLRLLHIFKNGTNFVMKANDMSPD